MISLRSVHLQQGSKFLLDGATLDVHPGQKFGVIGGNGTGKTSFFRLLLGELHEDSGNLSIPKDWQIAHMAQEVSTSHRTALEHVIDGDQPLRQLEQQILDAGDDGERLATLFEKMETIDGYSANARAQRLLQGLGFSPDDDNRLVTDFSGGWRIRLNLAKALMCRSDLLLLDEPTNHLDLDATLWLENWLIAYKGTLIVISHDRDFLDNVIDNTASIENKKIVSYKGNYSSYEKQRAERLAQQQAAFAKQQERIAEIENFVRRFRAKATKAKQAQSRLKELERMEKIAPAHVDSPFNFRFSSPEKTPQSLINLTDVDIGYNTESSQKVILHKVNFNLLASSRIGLLGHNGAGKSTLLKTLANETSILNGSREEGLHLKIGYFAQHQLEALDLQASPALHLQRLNQNAYEQEIRNFLGSFDFQGDRAFENISHFSGGEKARLALAIVVWQKPNLLLLDEPTNHLDLEMRHALTLALQAFEGALMVVSHDRYLLKNTVDNFLLVDSGAITEFDGSLDDYHQWLLNNTNESTATKNTVADKSNKDKKEQRQSAAKIREKLKPLTNEIKTLEKQMDRLQQQLSDLENSLANPKSYADNNGELETLMKEQGQLKKSLEEKEQLWLEKSDQLDTLQKQI